MATGGQMSWNKEGIQQTLNENSLQSRLDKEKKVTSDCLYDRYGYLLSEEELDKRINDDKSDN